MSCNCGFRKKIIESKLSYDNKKIVYMDYNSTTPVDTRVLGVYERACRNIWGNPSSLHLSGTTAWENLESSKQNMAKFFLCNSEDLVFYPSATAAINSFLLGLTFRNSNTSFISTTVEHSSVSHPLKIIKHNKNCHVNFIEVDNEGLIDLENLEKVFKNNSSAIFIYSPVNHETGVIQPVKKIYKLAKQFGVFVFIDAVQASVRMELKEWTSYCDFFCISGHKIYAPKGIALLGLKKKLKIFPSAFGGNQNKGLLPGTENTPGITALSTALEIYYKDIKTNLQYLKSLTLDGLRILQNTNIDLNINVENSAPGIINLSLPKIQNMEDIFYEFLNNNICLSRFSACSNNINGRSKILYNMGFSDEISKTSIRISLGKDSKREDFYRLAKVLKAYSS